MSLEIENGYSYAKNYELKSKERERERLEAENENIFATSETEQTSLATEDAREVVYEGTQNETQEDEQEIKEGPVGFLEGVGLFFKGFVNKVKNMGQAIIEHPLKTLAAVGATTALIAAAPLIGVASATAGAFLAVGFGVFAVGRTVGDIVETIKDNNEGRYDEVREDLESLGGDGLDLALTLPFMPKAINQLSRFFKYGTSTVGLNTELIGNIVKGNYKSIPMELAKANTKINYEMIANEMGLNVKPELEFFSRVPGENGQMLGGEFDPVSGKLKINQEILSGKNGLKAKLSGLNPEATIRHELEHFQQISEIARTSGIESLQETIKQYYTTIYQNNGGTFEYLGEGELTKALENASSLQDRLYSRACDKIWTKLHNNEITFDEAINMIDEAAGTAWDKTYKPVYDLYNTHQNYRYNALTKMRDMGLDYNNSENILLGDGSCVNTEFWQNVIDSNAASSAQAGNSAGYTSAFIQKATGEFDEKLVAQLMEKYGIEGGIEGMVGRTFRPRAYSQFELELYKSNLLENEAYSAQELFNSQVVQGRPELLADSTQAVAAAEEYFSSDDENLKEFLANNFNKKNAIFKADDDTSPIVKFFANGGLIGYLADKLAD